ncbi:HD domain-containing protein [Candidatus Uhrbacteria bacterium]|nr:HD domain-containing protein [Candidatus Uhrbacteria bacterium]
MTNRIKQAIALAINAHGQQKRKGKELPYVIHPLDVALMLARAGADEETIIAGILHDTIEDSPSDYKVTRELIAVQFGERVAGIVENVSEPDKSLSWEDRKSQALEHMKTFSHDSLLVKSADVISNATELLEDFEHVADKVFERFNAPKQKIISHYRSVMQALLERWDANPLANDLQAIAILLYAIPYEKEDNLVAFIRLNISFIRSEIGQINAPDDVKKSILELCAHFEDALPDSRTVSWEDCRERIREQINRCRTLVDTLDGRADAQTAHLLLMAHVADIMNAFKGAVSVKSDRNGRGMSRI